MAGAVWGHRVALAAMMLLACFVALLPFGPGEGGVPGPDLTLCLAFAWVLRRPDYVPAWLLVPVLLLEDALLFRPLGLWTLIVLLATEYLRRRGAQAQALPFWSELGLVTGCVAAAFAAQHLALVLLLSEPPPAAGQALHALATIVFYPPVVAFGHLVGVRRPQPGDLDGLGARA